MRLKDRWEDIPSPYIQEIARTYCKYRPITRPNISVFRFVCKWILVFVLVDLFNTGIFVLLYHISKSGVFLADYSSMVISFLDHGRLYLYPIILSLAVCLSLLRWVAIDCVKLYQKYAPEHIRRRCIMVPSCSDFAIIAFKKYGFVYGAILTWYRLFRRCRGTIYRIEYP